MIVNVVTVLTVSLANPCTPLIRETAYIPWTHQTKVEITFPLGCKETRMSLRLRTRNGGLLPPGGKFVLRAGYPNVWRIWASPGYQIEKYISTRWVVVWED